jgi:hypothetical protein
MSERPFAGLSRREFLAKVTAAGGPGDQPADVTGLA